jgi:hypothetical protein
MTTLMPIHVLVFVDRWSYDGNEGSINRAAHGRHSPNAIKIFRQILAIIRPPYHLVKKFVIDCINYAFNGYANSGF